MRYFKYDNTWRASTAISLNFMAEVPAPQGVLRRLDGRGRPCTDLNNRVSETGHVPRVNLTYKFTPDVMAYAT